MTLEEWLVDQVEVTISGVFSTHHYLQTATAMLGELTMPAFGTGGVLHSADGRELTARQTSWWRGHYELREGEVVLATAWPRGFLRRGIVVQSGDREYTLEPAGPLTRNWLLVDQTGTTVLQIAPRGFFRRGAFLTILGAMSVDLLAFTYYLVHKRWQAETAAAAAAAS